MDVAKALGYSAEQLQVNGGDVSVKGEQLKKT